MSGSPYPPFPTIPSLEYEGTRLKLKDNGDGTFSLIVSGGVTISPPGVGVFIPGTLSNGQICLYLPMDRPIIFPANAPNSVADAKTAATASSVFSVKQNGNQFATVTFSAGGTTGAFVQASDAVFAIGDILEIDGPATADATLANVGITLQGNRS
jgi:hypothetical protein